MVYPRILAAFYTKVESYFREKGLIAGRVDVQRNCLSLRKRVDEALRLRFRDDLKSGRHMKFPYTLSAKMAQFPIFYYMKHNNIWMYYPLGWVAGFYLFAKIHFMANSKENQVAWAETQRRAAEKEHHHD